MGILYDGFEELKDTLKFGYEECGPKDTANIIKDIFGIKRKK